ncbi:hypothetical protein EXIGLDRAFT_732629 [Exidia glandulosa HHB12029]|uniref:Uncharacterized protein n=1 Tax=Exidia glandulosa HHB12029 TaxID=1314781 RepID=A0A165BG22_EXIGL|nr:hypothetical protein EXIGLDRAFT_732629 [Exidia glandulosa HHB12029]
MGAYISRCWNPPMKAHTSGAPTPANGARAATSTQSADEPSATTTTTQVAGPVSPGAASPEPAGAHVPASEGVEHGKVVTPRVDRQMSIPISIADSDDGTPKGPGDDKVVPPKQGSATGPKPKEKPPPKPKPGEVKRRFRLPFSRMDEE